MTSTEVVSTFQNRPCYRYIRKTDRLPTCAELDQVTIDSLDNVCKVRLFNPTGIGTWWLAAYDPDTENAWGVAEIHEREVGAIWIPELVAYRGRFGLPLERDLHYSPTTVREILEDDDPRP